MHTIWIERGMPPECEPLLDGIHVIGYPSHPTPNIFATLSEANAIIASIEDYNASVMDKAPNLKIISRTGVGYDKVSIPDATERGIVVCNAPDAPTVSTAEHALMLILAVAKNLKQREVHWRNHAGDTDHLRRGVELDNAQLGLIGFGRIGQRVARGAIALGMNVLAYDPYFNGDTPPGAKIVNQLDHVLNTSDVISLHLPLTNETQLLMNKERFSQMKRGAIFINTARGGIVDESALLDALESGHLYGAGLDVTNPEPPNPDNPLLHREDVIATPHVASHTQTGFVRLYETAIRQAREFLETGWTSNIINPEALTK